VPLVADRRLSGPNRFALEIRRFRFPLLRANKPPAKKENAGVTVVKLIESIKKIC
jgi:hypothetical protein